MADISRPRAKRKSTYDKIKSVSEPGEEEILSALASTPTTKRALEVLGKLQLEERAFYRQRRIVLIDRGKKGFEEKRFSQKKLRAMLIFAFICAMPTPDLYPD